MSTVSPLPWYKQVAPHQRKALFSAWLGYVFDGFDFMLITYILFAIQKDLGIDNVQTSSLFMAAFVARPIGGMIFGSLCDRFGRKPIMIAAIVVYSIGTALCGLSVNFASLFCFRLIVGIGMAGEYACSAPYAVESWPKHLRGLAGAILVSGFSVGNIAASWLMPLILDAYNWRVAFFSGLIPVIIVLYIRRHAPESDEWQQSKDQGKTNSFSVGLLFKGAQLPVTLTIFAVMFGVFSANWPIPGLMPKYLAENGYQDSISSLMSMAGLGIMTGVLVSGYLADKFGIVKIFVGGLCISLLLVFPTFMLGEGQNFILGILLFFLLATNLGVGGLIPKYLSTFFPAEMRGAAFGFIYNLAAVGGGIAPVVCAFFTDRFGLGMSLVYVTGFWTLFLVIMVGLHIPDRIQKHFTPSVANDSKSTNANANAEELEPKVNAKDEPAAPAHH